VINFAFSFGSFVFHAFIEDKSFLSAPVEDLVDVTSITAE
jgi:hypothetical protein